MTHTRKERWQLRDIQPVQTEPPVHEIRVLATEFLPGLWLSGEDGLDECLFGEQAAQILISTGRLPKEVHPQVDVWIDFRNDNLGSNRRVIAPASVTTVRFPLRDGDLAAARSVFPAAKTLVDHFRKQDRRILVSCHAGFSRSAAFALWIMSEKMGYETACEQLARLRPYANPQHRFAPLLEEMKAGRFPNGTPG